MVDTYVPSGLTKNFADFSSFVADANAINAATKTALILALNNVRALMGDYNPATGVVTSAAHPDFNKIEAPDRFKLQTEIDTLTAAITAHA